ncbi:MAG: hypothetical protein ACKOPO_11320 [Novosphingobium sp.]
MARVIAHAATAPQRLSAHDLARSVIVIGCALALILAGRALPF